MHKSIRIQCRCLFNELLIQFLPSALVLQEPLDGTARHYPQAFPAYGWQHASFSAGCAAAAAIYYWVGFWCLLVPVAVGALIAILTEED